MLFVFFFRLNIDNGLNVPFLLLCVERAFPSAAAEAATDPTHTHTHTRARARTQHTHTRTCHSPPSTDTLSCGGPGVSRDC